MLNLIKVALSPPPQKIYIYITFYFILKAISFSRYSSFCLDFFVILKKRLDEKYKITFKPG